MWYVYEGFGKGDKLYVCKCISDAVPFEKSLTDCLIEFVEPPLWFQLTSPRDISTGSSQYKSPKSLKTTCHKTMLLVWGFKDSSK